MYQQLSYISKIDINKSSGLSLINSKLLKIAFASQSARFCRLLNLCISASTFPLQWKVGTIVPLPKKGDTRFVTNVRPVALLPIPGKILEKFLEIHLSNYLEDSNILIPDQGGFRRYHNTQLSAFKLCEQIASAINTKQYSLATSLDIFKASNTINHQTISNKLLSIGVNNKVHNILLTLLL